MDSSASIDAAIDATAFADAAIDAGIDAGPNYDDFRRPYDCDTATLALYHLDSDLADACGSAHLSSQSTSTVIGAPGFGSARAFAAEESVLFAPSEQLAALDDSFTIEAWIRIASWPAADRYAQIAAIDNGESGGAQWFLAINSQGKPVFGKALADCTNFDPELGIVGSSAIDTDAWTHLAASFDGSTYRIAVNGSTLLVTGETPIAELCASSSADLTIGNAGNSLEPFSGLIDEVRYSSSVR